MSTTNARRADWRTPTVVLVASGLILTLSMGIRHGFGLFLQPMSADLHWGRETFALALAVQNLMWGVATPFAGMLADRFGSHRVAFVCALLYIAGLATMAMATTPLMLVLTAGVLIGTGLAGLSFSVVAGVLGRKFPPEKRSMALGISAAAGSFGQFALLPLTQVLLSNLGWYGALFALAGVALLMIPLSVVDLRAACRQFARIPAVGGQPRCARRSAIAATCCSRSASSSAASRSCSSACTCPRISRTRAWPPHVAVTALALIGLFNIVGTWTTGWLGSRMPKRYILSAIYFAPRRRVRAVLLPAAVAVDRSTRSQSRSACCGCRRCRRPTASSRRSSACAISRCSPA